ncbi:MAG: endolytic transglycosylase MltG [Rhodoluna sp.]
MTDLRPRQRRSKKRSLIVTAVALVVAMACGFALKDQIREVAVIISGLEYQGSSGETVNFVISKGENGQDIARRLVSEGITKDLTTTLRNMNSANPTFFPGVYKIQKQISSRAAIDLLSNPSNMILTRVTIREGLRLGQVFKLIAEKTGLPLGDFESEATNLAQFNIPKAALNLEGYLFPATYDFSPSLTARDVLKVMVQRTKDQLITDGVPKSKWHSTLTLASIVQSEARKTEDFYKVSRTFQNRLEIGMPLQSDATVNYGVGSEDIYTSDAERADANRYNTYRYPGLPIGPISGAGALAIDAVLKPADGNWFYFCTVNLKTGETVFSHTYGEHQLAVRQWLKWMRENPGWDD